MKPSDETLFAARLLETSADAFAARGARELVDAEPAVSPLALPMWRALLRQLLDDMVAALLVGEPRVLTRQMAWMRSGWSARGVEPDRLDTAVRALEATLRSELPSEVWPTVERYLLQSTGVADAGSAVATDLDPALDTGRPLGTVALTYFEAVLEGRRRSAIDGLVEALEAGTPLIDLYEQVLIPVQRELGEMWHRGEIMISEEHASTSITRRAMAVLCQLATPKPCNGRTAILVAAEGNTHDMGVRILADLLELDGWRSIDLGCQVPIDDLLQAIGAYEADLLLLSATLTGHLAAVRATIEAVRAQSPVQGLKIVVGGRACDSLEDPRSALGADGYARTAREALPEAARLVGLARDR